MSSRTAEEVVAQLRSLGDPKAVEGAARFGIDVPNILGVSAPALRKLAKEIGTDHRLAGQLWRTGIHDARGLAALIDDPALVTQSQMERWAKDFNSWAVCDAACGCLFDKTPYAWDAVNWALRQIGKRNPPSADLNERAIQTAHKVRALGTRSARWIAADPPPADAS